MDVFVLAQFIGILLWGVKYGLGEKSGDICSGYKQRSADDRNILLEDDVETKRFLCQSVIRASCDACQNVVTKHPKLKARTTQMIFQTGDEFTLLGQGLIETTNHITVCNIRITNHTEKRGKYKFKARAACSRNTTDFDGGKETCWNADNSTFTVSRVDGCLIDCTDGESPRVQCNRPKRRVPRFVFGVIGGLLGSFVIAVVLAVVKRIRKKMRPAGRQNKEEEDHIYLGLKGVAASTIAPDVESDMTEMTVSPQVAETSTNEYEELPECRLPKIGLSDSDIRTSPDTQGEYVDLKDGELEEGVYSLEKASARPLPKLPHRELQNNKEDTYNRLGTCSEPSGRTCDTYNRAGDLDPDRGVTAQMQPSADYFVLENEQGTKNAYNKLREPSEPSTRSSDIYNKNGQLQGTSRSSEVPSEMTAQPVEYFTLENVDAQKNKDEIVQGDC